jgi:hypothetical protein
MMLVITPLLLHLLFPKMDPNGCGVWLWIILIASHRFPLREYRYGGHSAAKRSGKPLTRSMMMIAVATTATALPWVVYECLDRDGTWKTTGRDTVAWHLGFQDTTDDTVGLSVSCSAAWNQHPSTRKPETLPVHHEKE